MCRHYPTLSLYQKENVHPSILSSPTPEARQIIQVRYTQRIQSVISVEPMKKKQEEGKKTVTVKQKNPHVPLLGKSSQECRHIIIVSMRKEKKKKRGDKQRRRRIVAHYRYAVTLQCIHLLFLSFLELNPSAKAALIAAPTTLAPFGPTQEPSPLRCCMKACAAARRAV